MTRKLITTFIQALREQSSEQALRAFARKPRVLNPRLLITVSLVLLFGIAYSTRVFAQEQFVIDAKVTYQISESGIASVTNTITIENLSSEIYAPSYSLKLTGSNPQNIEAFEGATKLMLQKTKENNNDIFIKVTFTKALVGRGKTRTFTISYDEEHFAEKTGEVWEISIPKLADKDSFRSYSISLSIPTSFGNQAYISPEPLRTESVAENKLYYFDKESVAQSGITAGFGQFQVFSFSLNYHLENPLNKKSIVQIAIPPDTSLQKIYYQSIDPAPTNVFVDPDGNWLAEYNLSVRERLDVVVQGSVQIYASPRVYTMPSFQNLENNKSSTQYWQSDNEQIKKIAEELATPKKIYDYVVSTLNYNYDRVKPNALRMGAVEALLSPNEAICTEFTDLFIALSRAAGIPAREINGFAYTQNPTIMPLSLVADVLHAWPEYWDKDKKTWVAVDPTWESTTGGVDFFNKLDLRHFTFVIHGADPLKPYAPGSYKLGSNPQKDVFVNFGQSLPERIVKPKLVAKKREYLFWNRKIEVEIKNPGPGALYDLKPKVYFDNKLASTENIEILAPFANHKMSVSLPFSFWTDKSPHEVMVTVKGEEVVIPTNKSTIIINTLILILVFLVVVSFIALKISRRRS